MRRSLPSALPRLGGIALRPRLAPMAAIEWLIARRLWIPVLGVMLLGIVFVQVSMLSMNTGIGSAMKRSATLERDNAALRSDLSRMTIGSNVTDAAAKAGMVVPGEGGYRTLSAGDPDSMTRRAIERMTAPKAPVESSAAAIAATQTVAPTTGNTAIAGTTTQVPTAQTPTASTTGPTGATNSTGSSTPTTTGQSQAQSTGSATQIVTTSGGGAAAPGT